MCSFRFALVVSGKGFLPVELWRYGPRGATGRATEGSEGVDRISGYYGYCKLWLLNETFNLLFREVHQSKEVFYDV